MEFDVNKSRSIPERSLFLGETYWETGWSSLGQGSWAPFWFSLHLAICDLLTRLLRKTFLNPPVRNTAGEDS